MELSNVLVLKTPRVVSIRVFGEINHSNYKEFMDYAKNLLLGGNGYYLLDLENCHSLSLSGVFALYNIALIANHLPTYSPEGGWNVFHSMKEETRCLNGNLKLIHLQPNVLQKLEYAGLLSCLGVYPQTQDALLSF
jgi:anti-anti-sigma regulatory factor